MKRLLFLFITTLIPLYVTETLTRARPVSLPQTVVLPTPKAQVKPIALPTQPVRLRPTPTSPLMKEVFKQRAEEAALRNIVPKQPAPTPQVQQKPIPQPIPKRQIKQPISPNVTPITKQSVAVAVANTIHIINQTKNDLGLYIITTDNQLEHIQNLDAATVMTSVSIPERSSKIYVQDINHCAPISLTNGLQAITITNQDNWSQIYTMQPLIPQYENYVLIYNGSLKQQQAFLELTMPSNSWVSSLFEKAQKLSISKTMQPQTIYIIEIPKLFDTHSSGNPKPINPTSINFSVSTLSAQSSFPIMLNTNNNFMITQQNSLIQSN
jgi:hypothetical protein